MTKNEIKLMTKLIKYSERYNISIQIWPEQTAIFIEKDDVDLGNWGAEKLEETLEMGVTYLDRINKKGHDKE